MRCPAFAYPSLESSVFCVVEPSAPVVIGSARCLCNVVCPSFLIRRAFECCSRFVLFFCDACLVVLLNGCPASRTCWKALNFVFWRSCLERNRGVDVSVLSATHYFGVFLHVGYPGVPVQNKACGGGFVFETPASSFVDVSFLLLLLFCRNPGLPEMLLVATTPPTQIAWPPHPWPSIAAPFTSETIIFVPD